MASIYQVNIDEVNYDILSAVLGTSISKANDNIKVVDLADFNLVEGIQIKVKFEDTNYSENPLLDVGDTGAKPIVKSGGGVPGNTPETSWKANSILEFIYEKDNWVLLTANDTVYKAGEGLDLKNSTFSIGDESIVSTMIADQAITAEKIKDVDVNALKQSEQDTLILNGGNASL